MVPVVVGGVAVLQVGGRRAEWVGVRRIVGVDDVAVGSPKRIVAVKN